MGGVAIGLVAFFMFLTSRLNTGEMSLLYGDLEQGDSGKIVEQLESRSIKYQLRANGRQIMVPADRVLRLRMSMAQEGLPNGGSVGYEIFDRSDGIGTTNFVQNINLVRALEGELARTIRSLDQVQYARVHLVMPKRELFSRGKREPSASVVIKPRSGNRLSKTQVLAIQNLVAAAIPGLDANRISIVDSRGRLLARAGKKDGEGAIVATNSEEIRLAYEQRLRRTIEDMLEQSLGAGRVRAQVTMEMDFDRISTNSETYDPDSQVARSIQSVEDKALSNDGSGGGSVSVGNNLPDADSKNGGGGANSSVSERTEETVNYEISKTVRSHVRESGIVRRISVAVLVDGTYTKSEDGKTAYQSRPKEEMGKLTTLVRSAIGFDAKRGDIVELINMRFSVPEEDGLTETEPLFGLSKGDYFRIGEIFVLAIVGILVILLVVRPLVARTLDALPSAIEAAKERALLADQHEEALALAGPAGTGVSGTAPEEIEDEAMIDLAAVEGRVKASTLKKISEIVERHPEETVGILRQWMYSET